MTLHNNYNSLTERRAPTEAIRDYLRKAQLCEVLERILELGDRGEGSEEEIKANLGRIREKVYQKMIAPKLKKARAA